MQFQVAGELVIHGPNAVFGGTFFIPLTMLIVAWGMVSAAEPFNVHSS